MLTYLSYSVQAVLVLVLSLRGVPLDVCGLMIPDLAWLLGFPCTAPVLASTAGAQVREQRWDAGYLKQHVNV